MHITYRVIFKMHIIVVPQFFKITKNWQSNDAMSAREKTGPNFHATDHAPIFSNSAQYIG